MRRVRPAGHCHPLRRPQDIITEETGVLVPVDDPQAMAQAMLEMLDRAAGYDQERIRASTWSGSASSRYAGS